MAEENAQLNARNSDPVVNMLLDAARKKVAQDVMEKGKNVTEEKYREFFETALNMQFTVNKPLLNDVQQEFDQTYQAMATTKGAKFKATKAFEAECDAWIKNGDAYEGILKDGFNDLNRALERGERADHDHEEGKTQPKVRLQPEENKPHHLPEDVPLKLNARIPAPAFLLRRNQASGSNTKKALGGDDGKASPGPTIPLPLQIPFPGDKPTKPNLPDIENFAREQRARQDARQKMKEQFRKDVEALEDQIEKDRQRNPTFRHGWKKLNQDELPKDDEWWKGKKIAVFDDGIRPIAHSEEADRDRSGQHRLEKLVNEDERQELNRTLNVEIGPAENRRGKPNPPAKPPRGWSK